MWDKLGMDHATFAAMPPSWRLAQGQAHQAAAAHPRRPVPDYRPTPEQQTELDAIPTMSERMTVYRQMRDAAAQTPLPPQP